MSKLMHFFLVVFISTGLAGAEEPGTSLLRVSDQIRFSRDTVTVELSAERGSLWGLERSQDAEPSAKKGKINTPLVITGLIVAAVGAGMAAQSTVSGSITGPLIPENSISVSKTDEGRLAGGLGLVGIGTILMVWGL